ncbi:MAG: GGDEF domain-containing protein [Acidobacteria bacterium]|nr:GGDEF domain-containing protein [Acidobacteriota bacterium]
MAALEKEIAQSERFGHPFALMLLGVDRLADINATHGYGAGDRVIERVGIVVRSYFRDTDWVARVVGDTFAVLLPETERLNAERLADRVRIVVSTRLQLHDYRSDQEFR